MKRLASWAAGLVLVGSVATYAALPGYHRVATPTLFGMTRVAPGIFTDAPDRAQDFAVLITQAEATTDAFFGQSPRKARILFCATQACADRFGLRVSGVALGQRTILLAPRGINATILTHEQMHLDLRQHMTLRDALWPRFPAWFDEGLASLMSRDDRLTQFTPEEARFILDARTRRDWSRMTTGETWRDTYGAARAMVAALLDQIGQDGMRALIRDVGDGMPFDQALTAREASDFP